MKQRVITGIVMGLVLIPIVALGNVKLFSLLALFLGLGASYELAKLYKSKLIFIVNLVVLLVSADTLVFNLVNINPLLIAFLAFICFSTVTVLKDKDMSYLTHGLFSMLYVGLGIYSVLYIYNLHLYLFYYLLIIALGNDIFAYFTGVKFGKHKMAPTISPKKSIEGAIGGIVLSNIAGLIYIFVLNKPEFYLMLLAGVPMAFCGIIGDLLASKIKRDMGIKDFSNIFPGHGGVLDRFDSVLFCSMIFYFVLGIIA